MLIMAIRLTHGFFKKADSFGSPPYRYELRKMAGIFEIDEAMSGALESSDTWIAKEPMPVSVGWAGTAVYGGKIYVFGGQHKPTEAVNVLTNTLQIFDPAANRWRRETMPCALAPVQAAVVGDFAYVFANYAVTNGVILPNRYLYCYQFESNQWSSSAYDPFVRLTSGATRRPSWAGMPTSPTCKLRTATRI